MISPTPTHPQDAGNRARIFQLAEQLRSFGCSLYFAYYPMEGGDFEAMKTYWGNRLMLLRSGFPKKTLDLIRKIALRGKQCFVQSVGADSGPQNIDAWYDRSIRKPLLRLHRQVDFQFIWLEYVFLSKILDSFDSCVTKVIDTHDVFANRHELLSAHGAAPEWFSTTPPQEMKGLSRADIIVAIKESEAAHFRNSGMPAVATIGHLFPVSKNPTGNKPNVILFAASDNPVNRKAWQFFVEKLLPVMTRIISRTRILVAGRICRCIPSSPHYEKAGVVADLHYLYKTAKVAINPATFGTGLSIKSIEPLAFGCPVVTISGGIEGIESAEGEGVLVGHTPLQFVEHIRILIEDFDFYAEQSRKAKQFADRYFKLNRRRLGDLLALKSCPEKTI
jgi:hypothetical protein